MTPRKIILPGGNGYLGRLISRHFAARGDDVVVLTRSATPARPNIPGIRHVPWNGTSPGPWMAELENADAVINLAGRNVNCRYHRRNRDLILRSRVDSTTILGQAIAACRNAPPVWINSSSATIYRHAEDREMDEATGELGRGFSVEVCQAWEAALEAAPTPQTRRVALRSAMVMGPGSDGVYGAFHRLARLKLGGTLGNGRQYVSWVHWRDFLQAIDHILAAPHLDGPINVASPNPLPNSDFMRILREADRQAIGLPTPAWMLAIGAFFLRTETELVLKSRRVIPARLVSDGFIFDHPHWESAVRDLLGHPIHPLLRHQNVVP